MKLIKLYLFPQRNSINNTNSNNNHHNHYSTNNRKCYIYTYIYNTYRTIVSDGPWLIALFFDLQHQGHPRAFGASEWKPQGRGREAEERGIPCHVWCFVD